VAMDAGAGRSLSAVRHLGSVWGASLNHGRFGPA
jgi:hypothetical protein